jgi:hypothetical protein
MLFNMIKSTTGNTKRKRSAAHLRAATRSGTVPPRDVESHPAGIETWILNHQEVQSFIREYDILLNTKHGDIKLTTRESDTLNASCIDVSPSSINISNIMLTVKEFDMPKQSTQSIHEALTTSEEILNLYQNHIGAHLEVNMSRFANCVEIRSTVKNDNISIKVFTDSTSHITGFKDPSTGLDLAWMMHQIISSMHPPALKKSHVGVSFDNVHADFSMRLPTNCVMNTAKLRELVNDGALDQFENADFEFLQVRPAYRFVSRNKREYKGLRINIMFRMYDYDLYQVCLTLFVTGNCIIRSKHPEAINKICILMIKFFSLM